ncbi:MAG: hypothetical protein ACLPKI_20640 [Streptosporangiaceae bacterium]
MTIPLPDGTKSNQSRRKRVYPAGELAKLDACNNDRLDFSADSDATNDTAEFTVTVRASSFEEAMATGVSCIRSAIHATGASTPGWDDRDGADTVVVYQVDSDEGIGVRHLVDA